MSKHLYFTFEENRCAPNSLYANGYTFRKHYFPGVGELESQGEEFECAVFLDTHPKVWYWVRNLSRRKVALTSVFEVCGLSTMNQEKAADIYR